VILFRILKEFREANVPLNLTELSQRLDIERSALDGMLQLLVREGKLHEVDVGTEICADCHSRLSCAQLQIINSIGKAYELVDCIYRIYPYPEREGKKEVTDVKNG